MTSQFGSGKWNNNTARLGLRSISKRETSSSSAVARSRVSFILQRLLSEPMVGTVAKSHRCAAVLLDAAVNQMCFKTYTDSVVELSNWSWELISSGRGLA